MKKIGLISDTHSYLHPRVFEHFKNCDEIWHAGDIGSIEVLDDLKKFKPTKAVSGNIDNHIIRSATKQILNFNCEGVNVLITHIGGYPPNYNPKTRALLNQENVDLFICGHSHILKVIFDKKRDVLHINPGAAGKYGIHKVITLVRFEISNGKVENLEVIELNRN
jgi:putative phosphoesterase